MDTLYTKEHKMKGTVDVVMLYRGKKYLVTVSYDAEYQEENNEVYSDPDEYDVVDVRVWDYMNSEWVHVEDKRSLYNEIWLNLNELDVYDEVRKAVLDEVRG